MTGNGSGKRGRPLGFRLSEASKRSISMSKTGQRHRSDTKDKISRSLIMHFRRKNPLSEELINRYCRFENEEVCSWINEVQEELDYSPNIITEKVLSNKNKIELTCGPNIEFFSHNITPELIVLFKEYCNINNLNFEEAVEVII